MPRQFPALEALQPALRHTWTQLFKPFRLGLWARLALVGIATGEIPGCGGGGGGAQSRAGHGDQLLSMPTDAVSLFLLISLGVLVGVVLILALIYVSAIFRFVLFDIVLTDRQKLMEGWWRWQERGFSFFLWQLAFAAAMIVTLVIVVGVPALVAAVAGVFESQRPGLAVVIVVGMWLVLSLMAVILVAMIVWVLARDFVVPIMALEEVGVVEGWRRFLPMLLAEKLNYLVYLIIRTGLAVASLIFFGILALLLMIVALLVFGGMGLTLVLAGLWAEWTWNLYTILLAVVLGGAALMAVIYAIAFLCTPAVAFFPTYAAHVLAFRHPRLSEALSRHPGLIDTTSRPLSR